MSMDWNALTEQIAAATGSSFSIRNRHNIGGGCINEAVRLAGDSAVYFVKLNRADHFDMFAAETEALNELRQCALLRTPRPVCHGVLADRAYLVLEWLELKPADDVAMGALGEGLAELHGIVRGRHGWHRDNTLGSTPQRNAPSANWREFFAENRLAYQLELAVQREGGQELARIGDKLLTRLDGLLEGHEPEPSLLHGDLWSGNIAMDGDGRPVIFDPAVYYGDRETDLAMTELFGGFAPVFYEAYHAAWPLDSGYRQVRRSLYQLYHLLNHWHLFGGHYGESAHRCMERLLAEAS